MPYTADKPELTPSSDELRARIPGWGADLDPRDRPSVPRERFDPEATGAHWDFPERQPERVPRERSVEHEMLPPVFGTTLPLRGVSGAVRRFAFRYGEGRAAHWLLLLGADRIDAWEHHALSLLTSRPDNPVTETGVRAEVDHDGLASRLRERRVDLRHQWLDPVVVAGPWVLAAALASASVRAVVRATAAGRRP